MRFKKLNRTEQAILDFIFSKIEIKSPTILDIGCGDKKFHPYLPGELTSLDAWPKTEPDYLLDLSEYDIPFYWSFDYVLMIDFIEHLEKERGIEIIQQAKRIASKGIFVFTPLVWDDNNKNVKNPKCWYYKNLYNIHRSLWNKEEFENWETTIINQSIIAYWRTRHEV